MGKPLDLVIFALAFGITLYRGAIWSFVTVFLPVLLLLSATAFINLPSIPDMDARAAVIYGIMFGVVLKGGEPLPFRFGFCDLLIVALTVSSVLTAVFTEKWWTGVNVLGFQFMNFIAPYFLARAAFHLPAARRRMLWTAIGIIGGLAILAPIELRLYPFFITRVLRALGLYVGQNGMIMMRFHLFRTQLTFNHPIDVGNAGLLLASMIGLLAATTMVGLRNIWVQLGILAAVFVSLTSMSYTSYAALFAGIGLFLAMWYVPTVARALPLVVIVMIIGGFVMAHRLETMSLGERTGEMGQSISDSLWVRAEIMQNSWPFAKSAGLFGHGNTIKKTELELDSVDNSYLLMLMTRGWVYLALFLMLAMTLAVRVSRTYARSALPQHRVPIAIASAAILGTMVGMFTVWFGFVYSYLWLILLAMAHSALDVIWYGLPAPATLPPAEAPIVAQARQPRRAVVSRPVPAGMPLAAHRGMSS